MRHLESNLQSGCVRWFRLKYPGLSRLLFAVPNGGSRNAIEAANLKQQGVVPGVSDLILLKPSGSYSSLCIEMKAGKNGQSGNQKEFQRVAELYGNKYIVCRTFDEFMKGIENYLNA